MNTSDAFSAGDLLQPVFLLAVLGVASFALTAKNVTHRALAWGVMYACWLTAMCSGSGSAFGAVIFVVLLAVPPLALVLVSWRLPRGRRDTVTAEIGLLILIAIEQWMVGFISSFDNSPEAPIETLFWFLFLAAAFIAAAIPVPTRRIAYGAAALACVLLAVFRDVLLWSETGQHPDVPFNDDLLVAGVFVVIPAIGTLAQIAWWAWRRASSRKA
ncbi:hypothetical protein [Glycomyces tenuis]|uniref:hypothetical protein n=1 Tax=Glycomyces tenuis TaxID=58116 RepID=UPI00042176C4|nr:hypothetical protein [Glycomyces tenuis]